MRRLVRGSFAWLLAAVPLACLPEPLGPSGSAIVARSYLTNLVDLMEAGSVNRKTIDWVGFREAVMEEGAPATSILWTYPAIQLALTLLGDKHSWFRTPEGNFFIGLGPLDCSAPLAESFVGLPTDIGYVRVGSYGGSTGASGQYTFEIQSAMQAIDSESVTGWIVDLRGNSGGNMWPMVAALWPFLQGVSGYFVDPDSLWTEWEVRREVAYLAGDSVATVVGAYAPAVAATGRVALLTDRRVSSAAEATAIAFRGRDNVRSFGTATCGQTTAIQPVTLSDGAILGLAVATIADRDSVLYGGALTPDEIITNASTLQTRAIDWIRTGN
jgi:hypothetical protein